ncbi:ABC transporter substrate-binding protein [Aquabacter sp. CN5-332]|uniref:ABC transporter substrate-binding protein n=1 Tax=Aquabacter sp. CN5-332 TaxID=3156608 RepID=UPI0032B47363
MLTRRACLSGLAAGAFCARFAAARGATPARIVAADWAAAESLLALGVVPLAVSDTTTFREWLPEIALPPSVLDLGSRAEPNLELLTELRPDLILVSNWQANLLGLFRAVAPAETVSIIMPRTDPMENARAALRAIADRIGRQGEATTYLAAFEAALRMAGEDGHLSRTRPVYIGVLHENGTQIFLYGPGSWVQSLMNRLGLRNALTSPTSAFGNALVDLAQLAATPDAALLYLDQGERTRRAELALRNSTLWQALPMVAQKRVRAIPPFYALGGIPSIWRCARLLSNALSDRSDG